MRIIPNFLDGCPGPWGDSDGWCGGVDGSWWPWMFIMCLGIWLIQLSIAMMVYKNAQKRGMNALMWFILIIIPCIGFFFLLLYLIFRSEKKGVSSAHKSKSARAILDERYASGEITRKEYIRMKDDLKK